MPYNTPEEKEEILNRVLESPSFSRHMSHPKLSNWFAWNKCASEQLGEFFAGRMVYEFMFSGEVTDPREEGGFEIGAGVDPRGELQAILRGGGGLKLAYKLMKDDLYFHAKIMSVAETACWDFYTDGIRDYKSPGDSLQRFFEMPEGWSTEPHLWLTFYQTLLDESNLDEMQIEYGRSDLATKALHLAWSIGARRGWTMSKHSGPPDGNALLLAPGPGNRATLAAETMKQQHANVFLSGECCSGRNKVCKSILQGLLVFANAAH